MLDEGSPSEEVKSPRGRRKGQKSKFRSTRGFRKIGKEERRHYFKSRWEANYARYLEWLREQGIIKDWLYEPETFWYLNIKRGVRSYLPDFKILDYKGGHRFLEVKGYMDAKSKTKIRRFKKYYPEERLDIVDGEWFKANADVKKYIPDWEN